MVFFPETRQVNYPFHSVQFFSILPIVIINNASVILPIVIIKTASTMLPIVTLKTASSILTIMIINTSTFFSNFYAKTSQQETIYLYLGMQPRNAENFFYFCKEFDLVLHMKFKIFKSLQNFELSS